MHTRIPYHRTEATFKQFYYEHWAWSVYWIMKRFSVNREDAEDVCIHGFTVVAERWTELEAPKHFLIRVIKNKALNNLTRIILPIVPLEGFDIEDNLLLIETEMIKEVYGLIEGLPTVARQIFKMYFLEDLTHEEISIVLHLNIQTVRNQKTRAIKLIRERLNIKV